MKKLSQQILYVTITKSLENNTSELDFHLASANNMDKKQVKLAHLESTINTLNPECTQVYVDILKVVNRGDSERLVTINKIYDHQNFTLQNLLKEINSMNLQDSNISNIISTLENTFLKLRGADEDIFNQKQIKTCISTFAQDGSADQLELALRSGIDMDQEFLNDIFGKALLSKTEAVEKVKILLEYDVNLECEYSFDKNSDSEFRYTPLGLVLINSDGNKHSMELTKLLLENGVNPNKTCGKGIAPEILRFRNGDQFAEHNTELRSMGEKLYVFTEEEEFTPFYCALGSKHSLPLTELLLQYKADPQEACYKKYRVTAYKNPLIIQTLDGKQYMFKPILTLKHQMTPLEVISSKWGLGSEARLLLNAGVQQPNELTTKMSIKFLLLSHDLLQGINKFWNKSKILNTNFSSASSTQNNEEMQRVSSNDAPWTLSLVKFNDKESRDTLLPQTKESLQPKTSWWNPLSWIGSWWSGKDKEQNQQKKGGDIESGIEETKNEPEESPQPKTSWWNPFSWITSGWFGKGATAENQDHGGIEEDESFVAIKEDILSPLGRRAIKAGDELMGDNLLADQPPYFKDFSTESLALKQ